MWIFTKHGFYSAVCARQGDGAKGKPVDSDRIMVRARLRSHLDALRERFPDSLHDCEIVDTPEGDYACRIFVPKSVWTRVLAELAEETDYDDFKSKVKKQAGPQGAAYIEALGKVWRVMLGLQRHEH